MYAWYVYVVLPTIPPLLLYECRSEEGILEIKGRQGVNFNLGFTSKNCRLLVVVVLVSSELLPRKVCTAYPSHAWMLLPLRADLNMMQDKS